MVRDALATAGALSREALRLTADRIVPGAGIPRRTADVDAAWLTRVLEASFPGVRVGSIARLGANAGTTDRIRIGVAYDGVESGAAPPPSVFVKLPPADVRTRLFVNVMRLGETEARFYRDLAPRVPVETPRVFHAATGGVGRRFVLVLEDLEARGVTFADAARPVSLDVAGTVMRALGRLHAAFWDRSSPDGAWLKSPGRDPTYRVGRFVSALATGPALRRFVDVVPSEVVAAAPRITAARDALEAAWARGPLTLVHGDAHAGNLYFPGDAVGFLDWQVAQRAQGMRDVTYFLVLSLPSDVRRAHERELIALYLETIAHAGVTAPSMDGAWTQHRLHAFYAWIAAVVTAAAATLQTEDIVRAGLARSSAALLELDSLALLAGL